MLRFERELLVADLLERTIEGVIVPYGEVGVIAGREYRFKPGSLRLGRRVPLLVDHDRGKPIGVLAELVDGERGALGRFRVDSTPDGDQALTQAASGSRGALSIGAEVIRSSIARDGVVDVEAAHVAETSLLALGAFDSAEVLRVAAEQDEPAEEELGGGGSEAEPEEDEPAEPIETHPDQEELDPDAPAPPATDDPEEGDPMTTEASAAPSMILAERSPSRPELTAGEYVRHMIAASKGDRESLRFLEAALTESISTDLTGLLPPTYERTVLGDKTVPRVLYNLFRSKPIPSTGLAVHKPKWTTPPSGAWAADVDADATTSKVVIGTQQADLERWDWAGAIPWVVVQQSDPTVLDEIYGAAVTDFHIDVEAKIAAVLAAAAVGTATTIGAGIGDFYDATGRNPDVIIVAPDVWGEMADAKQFDAVVGAGGVSAAGEGLSSSFAGLPIVGTGAIAAGSRYLATRRAIDARTTEPVRLTANAIGAINVELGVVGLGLFDTDWPTELMALAPPAPLAARSAGARK